MTDLTFDMAGNLHQEVADHHARTLEQHHERDRTAAPLEPITASVPEKIRETVRIPRIAIQAFCDSPDVAAAIENAARDRLMSRARVTVQMGGVAAAISYYQQAQTPNLVVVESRSSSGAFLAELDQLAEVCDAGTKVMAIGHANDITFFRELMRRGVSEYMLAPIDPVSLISTVSSIYGESTPGKLGLSYAFIGAKGGVGASTVAHNVGWTIARQLESDVVLADLDLPFGTASLDFNVDTGMGVAEAIQDASRLDEVLLDRLLTKCGDHLSLLSAPTMLEKTYDLHEGAMAPLLEVAQSNVPFIILDMPHMWTAWTRNVLVAADEIVITAAPDLANLRNAKNLINILRQERPNDPLPKLVLNQVGMPKRPEIKPQEFAKALQLEPIACIPFDAHLFGTAANKGQMIADIAAKGAATKAFAEIADVITGRREMRHRRKSAFDLGSLFGKMKRAPGHRAGKGS